MPIYESAGSTMVHFGVGDIAICVGINSEDLWPELAFVRDAPGEIGRESPYFCGKSTDEIPCPVRVRFDSLASLCVLEHKLAELKQAIADHARAGEVD